VTEPLRVNRRLEIPQAELRFRTSRSGGPGGQHVNTSSTRVELLFDVRSSPSLREGQRARIVAALGHRLDQAGVLHLVSQAHRSQLQNKREVVERLQKLLDRALQPRKRRVATRPTRASRARHREAKRRQGAKKRLRRRPGGDE